MTSVPAARHFTPVRRLSRFVIGPAILALCLPAFAADIELKVGPVASAQGNLMVALYDSAATFRKKAVHEQQLKAVAGVMRVRFSNLAPGEYAIALFHDINGNGELETNLLGVPREPYGFSTIEKALLGPPGWNDVKFTLPAAGGALEIKLR